MHNGIVHPTNSSAESDIYGFKPKRLSIFKLK